MRVCEWAEEDDYWQTDCGQKFTLIAGTPRENKMEFCCYCGRVLLQLPMPKELEDKV